MKTLNANVLQTEIKSIFTRERFLEIVAQYKAYVNHSLSLRKEPHKKPCQDKMELYVMYVLLKGRNPECTTHDAESERYEDAVNRIKRYLTTNSTAYSHSSWCAYSDYRVLLDKALGLTDEEKLALSAAIEKAES